MIKDDPDGTVREEQNEAEINASGTDDTIKNETSEAARAFERLEDGWDEDKKEIEAEQIKEEVEVVVEPRVSDDVKNEGAVDEEPAQDTKEGEVKSETEPEGTTETETGSATDIEPEIAPEAEGRKSDTSDYEDMKLPPVDYSRFSKNELVETLGLIIDNRPPSEIREDVERIKTLFYKKLRQESEERKAKFLEEGGKINEYKAWVDPLDYQVKDLLNKYREKKNDYSRVQEAEKYDNLKKKYDIIDKIKDLVNREESINKTFQDFRSLQNEWHSIGVVPQNSLKDLWENYHHSVEIFYGYIKINKELRDLDLKKNLEAKVLLCEKAEELMLEPNPVSAFRLLQELHNHWREIGPVPQESKNEIWERFREATGHINKRHHEYFENQKEEQRRNFEAKIALCEEVEAINLSEMKSFRDFDKMADKIMSLQQMWRTIGFAPKKQNNKVYQRFREACDAFFEKKRIYYSDNREIQLTNMQMKTELCIQAEALRESTDWKATSDALIKLQREWKEIGPVPRKHSEKLWRRFRKACDHFFNRKSEHFNSLDTSYEENLKAKLAIIAELEKFEPGNDVHAAFKRLKELQLRWTEIGYVPFNKKEEITNRYRNALNKEFDRLKIADEDKSILKYRTKLDSLRTNPKASRKVRNERDKFFTKIKQLESDIVLWENNIGFFARSPNAETLIREVQDKIENAKKTIKMLEEKVRLIDQSGLDE